MATIFTYETSDGKVFDLGESYENEFDAKQHEQNLADDRREEQLYAAGSACLKKGNYQGALHYFSQLRSRQSMWYNSGIVYLRMGDYDNAIDVFSKAIHNGQLHRVDEHFAISSLAARGDIYLLKKSREKATGDYENAYKNGRNDHAAKQLLKIGKDYEKEGNRDQAIEIYTLLLERHQEYDPSTKQDVKNDHYSESNLTAYLARGDAYYAKGNKESALLDYVAVTDIAYDEELYWTKYGELYKSSIAVYAKLKEKALQALDNYTPVTKEEYFASAKSGDKDALAIIQHRAWEDRYQKWLNARRDTRFAPVRKFFTFPRLTWKSLLWGLALGAVCGLLSIVGIGILIALVFDMTDVSVPAGSALFWIWIALFTVVFLFVWLKRRWLWIALMCLPALFGIYVILGAPGLNRTQAESEPEPVPTEQPAE